MQLNGKKMQQRGKRYCIIYVSTPTYLNSCNNSSNNNPIHNKICNLLHKLTIIQQQEVQTLLYSKCPLMICIDQEKEECEDINAVL